MDLFVYSNIYLDTYCVPGIVLGKGNTTLNKRILALNGVFLWVERGGEKPQAVSVYVWSLPTGPEQQSTGKGCGGPVGSVWARGESRGQARGVGELYFRGTCLHSCSTACLLCAPPGPEILFEETNIGFVFDCHEPGQALGIIQEEFLVGPVVWWGSPLGQHCESLLDQRCVCNPTFSFGELDWNLGQLGLLSASFIDSLRCHCL